MRVGLCAWLLLVGGGMAYGQGTLADYDRFNRWPLLAKNLTKNARLDVKFVDDGKSMTFTRTNQKGLPETVRVRLSDGTRTLLTPKDQPKEFVSEKPRRPDRGSSSHSRSPDGEWDATLEKFNIVLRNRKNGMSIPLTTDGTAKDYYTDRFFWSTDSQRLMTYQETPGGDRQVTLVESAPKDQLQPKIIRVPYLKPGDTIPTKRLRLFNISTQKRIPIDEAETPNPWDFSFERWSPDSKTFFVVYNRRGHQVVRLLGIDAQTGAIRRVVNEECKTFFDYAYKLDVVYLKETAELIWMSERSGYNHLYRIDTATGQVKNPITQGNFVVRRIDQVDGDTVRVQVLGHDPARDPYELQFARVQLDGTGFTMLTPGPGTHEIVESPEKDVIVDQASQVDMPPVLELRRSQDGGLIATLDTTDATALKKLLPRGPER
ncbi:MAG: DPP IV N-terminal domain-containing protein, partial [Gemmataceae bacterium]